MSVHTMGPTATLSMWALMLLATVGFWVLVAVVVRVVVTRAGPGERRAPIFYGVTSSTADAAPAHPKAWTSPPPLPHQAETPPGRDAALDLGTGATRRR